MSVCRTRILVEYDGSAYVGWQRQDNGPSIQGALEEAAARLCGEEAACVAAGRTDAGVHAIAMGVHIDLPKDFPPDVVKDAINQHLRPQPIAIIAAERAAEGFHARFSATARHYLYRIVNRRAPLALDAGRAWRVPGALDDRAMDKAAQALLGKHDFSTFRAAQCQSASPVKTLAAISVRRDGEAVLIEVSAPSFLHSQVRSIAGSLVQVGLGRWSVPDFRNALAAADRAACGPVAPPDGLYFVRADYDAS